MKLRLSMPIPIYFSFLGRFQQQSRGYSVLKKVIVESDLSRAASVDIVCGLNEAKLLLDHARQFYPEAVPYIEDALNLGHSGLMIELIRGS
jgi:hypothetical protein